MRQRISIIERFLKKIKKQNDCWIWTGGKTGSGYGQFSDVNYKTQMAHRFAYTYYKKSPKNLYVCHRCDNKLCVNPDHLFLGTQKQNMQDMYKKGRNRKTITYKHGEDHCNSKLSNNQVRAIRQYYSLKTFNSYELADIYNISRTAINNIINRRTYATII